MARLLFLIILSALPSLVVPIHNSSAGGNLCVFVCVCECVCECECVWVCVRESVCLCLLFALMDRSNSAEIAKWPEWSPVICAARKASVKLTIYHVAVIHLHYLETERSHSAHVVFHSSSSSLVLRLRHYPASQGRGDPLQRPDTRTGTENDVTESKAQNFTRQIKHMKPQVASSTTKNTKLRR